jgi:hypothetical protein
VSLSRDKTAGVNRSKGPCAGGGSSVSDCLDSGHPKVRTPYCSTVYDVSRVDTVSVRAIRDDSSLLRLGSCNVDACRAGDKI